MPRPRGPDSGMATAIAIFMLAVIALCLGAGALAGWVASRWVPWQAAWTIGCLAGPVLAITLMVTIFPEMFRSRLDQWRAPTFVFQLPAGFRGRFYLVGDPAAAAPTPAGKTFSFEVPPGRVCRVKPFPGLDNAWAEVRATRPDGSEAPAHRDGWGASDGVVIRAWYVGTEEEWLADPVTEPDLRQQVSKLESPGN